jgi:hypothetical protein
MKSKNKKTLVMIYVIGGVTYGEIAAFRFLAKALSFYFLF